MRISNKVFFAKTSKRLMKPREGDSIRRGFIIKDTVFEDCVHNPTKPPWPDPYYKVTKKINMKIKIFVSYGYKMIRCVAGRWVGGYDRFKRLIIAVSKSF